MRADSAVRVNAPKKGLDKKKHRLNENHHTPSLSLQQYTGYLTKSSLTWSSWNKTFSNDENENRTHIKERLIDCLVNNFTSLFRKRLSPLLTEADLRGICLDGREPNFADLTLKIADQMDELTSQKVFQTETLMLLNDFDSKVSILLRMIEYKCLCARSGFRDGQKKDLTESLK